MKKYYTPDLEDLFIGYECEEIYNKHGDWCQAMPVKDGIGIDNLLDGISKGEVRTKYLDKEDIESCGWEYDEDSVRQLPLLRFVKYESGRVCNALWLDEDEHTIDIIQNNFNGGGGYYSIFKGECKSINELRKIMKMINIK